MIIQLPLTSDPFYVFTTTLGDTRYDFTIKWNDRGNVWTIDLVDSDTQATIFLGVPIVIGCDIFSPFNIGNGSLIAWDESGTQIDASFDDLGSRVNLYWFSADEVAAVLA